MESNFHEHRITQLNHVRSCTTCKAKIGGGVFLIALLAYWFFLR